VIFINPEHCSVVNKVGRLREIKEPTKTEQFLNRERLSDIGRDDNEN
jgi:hypothetical protein